MTNKMQNNRDTLIKPILSNSIKKSWLCPICGGVVGVGNNRCNYCPRCGQRIDFSDVEKRIVKVGRKR